MNPMEMTQTKEVQSNGQIGQDEVHVMETKHKRYRPKIR